MNGDAQKQYEKRNEIEQSSETANKTKKNCMEKHRAKNHVKVNRYLLQIFHEWNEELECFDLQIGLV